MRRLASLAIVAIALYGCSESTAPHGESATTLTTTENEQAREVPVTAPAGPWADLAIKLESAGLWRGLSEEDRAEAVRSVAAGTHPYGTTLGPDVEYFVDGEELAEGGVEEFLQEIAGPLKKRGVELKVRLLSDPESLSYSISINGEAIELYDESAWDSSVTETYPWYASTVRPLAAVNRLLTAAGARERFYTLYTGANDGIALLIAPAVVTALRESGRIEEKDIPFLPS